MPKTKINSSSDLLIDDKLDLNNQEAINAADPTQPQSLVTLAYLNAHGGGTSTNSNVTIDCGSFSDSNVLIDCGGF